MTNLVEAFLESGANVQLRHVPTETSWEDLTDHGYIAIFDDSGTKLLRRDGFQHNRKLRRGGAYDTSAVKEVVTEALAALVPKGPPSFIESELTTKVEYEAWIKGMQTKAGVPGAAAA